MLAAAARLPTRAETSGIRATIDRELHSSVHFPASCSPPEAIKVSTLDPGYAIATPGQMRGRCSIYNGNGFFLLKRSANGWSIVWQGSELPSCGSLPDAALADLTGGCIDGGAVIRPAQLEGSPSALALLALVRSRQLWLTHELGPKAVSRVASTPPNFVVSTTIVSTDGRLASERACAAVLADLRALGAREPRVTVLASGAPEATYPSEPKLETAC